MDHLLQPYEDSVERIVTAQLQEEKHTCIELINLTVEHSCYNAQTDVDRVDTAMLMRMVRDLRCILMMALRGYATQVASLAAGLAEQLGALAIVAGNHEHAKEWLQQSRRQEKGTRWHFPSKSNMGAERYNAEFVKGLVGTTWSCQAAKIFVRDTLSFLYEELCKAKHADPDWEILDYYSAGDNSLVIGSAPLLDDLQMSRLRLILAVSTFLVSKAYWVYMWHHSPPDVLHLRHTEYQALDAATKTQMERAVRAFAEATKLDVAEF